MSDNSTIIQLPYTIKARWRDNWIAVLLFSALGFLGLCGLFQSIFQNGISNTDPALLRNVTILILLFPGLFLLWLSFFRIRLLNDRIQYRSMFSRAEIEYKDIGNVEIRIGRQVNQPRNAWYQLIINRNPNDEGGIMVNMKPFGVYDLSHTLKTIAKKCPKATFDRLSTDVRNKNIASVISVGLKELLVYGFPLLLFISLAGALLRRFLHQYF